MGRSPGKWIKTLLFRKKSSGSHSSKGRDSPKAANNNECGDEKGSPALSANSPVISQPVLVSTNQNVNIPDLEKGPPSNLVIDPGVESPISQEAEKHGVAEPGASNEPEKFRQEQAAIKAQAAFRGYLARRVFHTLKGIIKLQALIRGHLVRRQAVVTLRSLQAIVRLQALFRGRRSRLSGIGLEVSRKSCQGKVVDAECSDVLKERLSTNAFLCKLLSTSTVALPLCIQYGQGEPDSLLIWLERWTSYCFWKPLHQSKKVVVLRSHAKRGETITERESNRAKRSVRRNSALNTSNGTTNVISETEKSKCNLRKVSSPPTDSAPEHPPTVLEKVKRNLRKVSVPVTGVSERPEIETDKSTPSFRKLSRPSSNIQDQGIEDSVEMNKDVVVTPANKPDAGSASILLAANGPIYASLDDHPAVEMHPAHNIAKDDSLSVSNGELNSKEERARHENQKLSKRRAYFSVKPEHYVGNGSHNSPTMPSYMAVTESAKAKVRGQGSPRFLSDSTEKNSFTRRHSLPCSSNGKLSSQSPRTQKLVQASCKGAIRNDSSLSSPRDGNDKAILVEWRR